MLSLSCKKYNKTITKENIKKNTVDEINRRLRIIFGDDCMELMQILREGGAIISGSFIIQCMLGETWKNATIIIKSATPEFSCVSILHSEKYESLDSIREFMAKYRRMPSKKQPECVVTKYEVNKIPVELILLESYKFCHLDKKNTYNVASDNLLVNNMQDIFTKCIKLYSNSGNIVDSKFFSKMYLRGFKFYKSNNDRTILSNADIYQLMCNSIKIKGKRKRKECDSYLIKNNFTMKGGIINCWVNTKERGRYKPYPVFDIDMRSPHYASIVSSSISPIGVDVRINKCTDHKNYCITKFLYPKVEHYHCIIRTNKKEFILIPSYGVWL
jgi:hypothetical protein